MLGGRFGPGSENVIGVSVMSNEYATGTSSLAPNASVTSSVKVNEPATLGVPKRHGVPLLQS